MNVLVLTVGKADAGKVSAALDAGADALGGAAYKVHAMQGGVFAYASPETMVRQELYDDYRRWNIDLLPWKADELSWERTLIDGAEAALDGLKESLKGASEVTVAVHPSPWADPFHDAIEALIACGWTGAVSCMDLYGTSEDQIREAFVSRRAIGSWKEERRYLKAEAAGRISFLSMQYTRAVTFLVSKSAGKKIMVRQGIPDSAIVKQIADLCGRARAERPPCQLGFRDELGNVFAYAGFSHGKDLLESFGAQHSDKVILDSSIVKSVAYERFLDIFDIASILLMRGCGIDEIISSARALYDEGYISYPWGMDGKLSAEQIHDLRQDADRLCLAVGIDPASLFSLYEPVELIDENVTYGALRPAGRIPDSARRLDALGGCAKQIYELIARSALCALGGEYTFECRSAYLSEHPDFKSTIQIPVDLGFKRILDADELFFMSRASRRSNGFGRTARPCELEAEGSPAPADALQLALAMRRLTGFNGLDKLMALKRILDPRCPLASIEDGVFTATNRGQASRVLLEFCRIASIDAVNRLCDGVFSVSDLEDGLSEAIGAFDAMLAKDLVVMRANRANLRIKKGGSDAQDKG